MTESNVQATQMTKPNRPNVTKWPFLLGDVLLLGVAWWIVSRSPDPFATLPLLIVFCCVGIGAWISIVPFLTEYRGSLQLGEADSLQSTAEKINELEKVGHQVAHATGQWQEAQTQADQTRAAVAEISERMTAEAKAFGEFMQKANDSEKQHLRLEVEKLRRSEGDWLQILVMMMDHVFALHRAALISKKASVIEQITNFRHACQDVARRIGLVALDVQPGTAYDAGQHQLEKPEMIPAEGAKAVVEATLAPGFTFQGKGLRKPLVSLAQPKVAKPETGDLFSQPDTSEPAGTEPISEELPVADKPSSTETTDVESPSLASAKQVISADEPIIKNESNSLPSS